jgi:hypothetical protein
VTFKKWEKMKGKNKKDVPGLVQSLKMDSTMAVTSSSLMGLRASSRFGEKSSRVQTFLTLT